MRMDRIRHVEMLPSLLTLSNAMCGFYAISLISGADENFLEYFVLACLLIFAGMIFDSLDGQVARLTKSESRFGLELDSLCDAVTFGIAPALLAGQIYRHLTPGEHPRMAWVFSAFYAACAILRLARYNAEGEDEENSQRQSFAGLPSPAGAALVSVYVLFFFDLHNWESKGNLPMNHWMLKALPMFAMFIGFLMVSRFPYPHFVKTIFGGKQPFYMLVLILFLAMLCLKSPLPMLMIVLGGYTLSGPAVYVYRMFKGQLDEVEDQLF